MLTSLTPFVDAAAARLAGESREFYAGRPTGHGPRDHDELLYARTLVMEQSSDPAALRRTANALGIAVPVRVILPTDATPVGVYLHCHGGGFYLGSPATADAQNRRIADALSVAVVCPDYRLAPENPWPAAPDDCEAVAVWVRDRGRQEFGTNRLVLGGTSAGATLAMTTLLRLRDSDRADHVVATTLRYGTYDLSGTTPAGRRIADEFFIEAYLGHVDDRTDPDISPVFADLSGLPPTMLTIGSEDILLEDNLTMAARLCVAGNDVVVRVYPESPHGFTGHPTSMAALACRDIVAWMARQYCTVSPDYSASHGGRST